MNATDLERIWFRTQSREWRTLAIVPTDVETADAALGMAKLLIMLGQQHEEKIGLADFRKIAGGRVSAFLQMADWYVKTGERLVCPTQAIDENPATVAVARAADGVLLCVALGHTRVRSVEDTIEQIGRERFIGTVIFRNGPAKPKTSEALEVRRADAEAVELHA